jgi:hypothetical protein
MDETILSPANGVFLPRFQEEDNDKYRLDIMVDRFEPQGIMFDIGGSESEFEND